MTTSNSAAQSTGYPDGLVKEMRIGTEIFSAGPIEDGGKSMQSLFIDENLSRSPRAQGWNGLASLVLAIVSGLGDD